MISTWIVVSWSSPFTINSFCNLSTHVLKIIREATTILCTFPYDVHVWKWKDTRRLVHCAWEHLLLRVDVLVMKTTVSVEYLQIILTLYSPNFATNGRLAEDCLGSFLYGAFQNDRIVLGRLSIL